MAYEVLSDSKKRAVYDEGGEQAIKEGPGGGGGGGGFGGASGGGPRKSKPIMHKLGVTLEDLFKGKTKKLAINREVACSECDGKGGSKVETCGSCRGRGMKV